jgi:hypothetical protein
MLVQIVRPILVPEEVLSMHAMPVPVLFGVVGAVLIVAIYFVWGRKSNKQ